MFLVFFFFKQKTAYEMRISDWSSDVCSSDLLQALAASAYQEARTTGQSFAIYRWPDGTADNKDELRYAYFSYFEPWDWVFAITDSAQIGRASCRERGCQYV